MIFFLRDIQLNHLKGRSTCAIYHYSKLTHQIESLYFSWIHWSATPRKIRGICNFLKSNI